MPQPLTLTPRQARVIAALSTGLTYRQAARRLGISRGTVGTHARRAYGVLFDGRTPLELSTCDPLAKTVRPDVRATALGLMHDLASRKAGTHRHRAGRGGSRKGGIRLRGPNGSQVLDPAKRRASIRRYVERGGRRAT